ncbi:MAG TPA: hypothetical protein VFQ80_14040 [Thermomicrobiales bacterium]|jgi:hypothetical protein|nr:hypothetical protein [Thermomicrobiales bacterium]
MDRDNFDRLARALASGASRRTLIRVGIVSGFGLVSAGGIAGVDAKRRGHKGNGKGHGNGNGNGNGHGHKGGNSACAHFCHAVFSGSAAGHCTADAAHGTGLCFQCGPSAPDGGVDPSTLQCGSGEEIDTTTCTCVSTTTCSAGGDACGPTSGRECGTDQSGTACFCASDADDMGACFLGDPTNCDRTTCDPSDSIANHGCADDERCVDVASCCAATAVCIPLCQPASASRAGRRK